ncbi:MAG: hypothetical protein ABW022_01885 [Actinoplanes sp.]
MRILTVSLAAAGVIAAVVGTVYSWGWVILAGGMTLLVGALAVPSAGPGWRSSGG